MNWLSEIFSSSVGEVVGKVGEAVDRLVTSDEEKLKLANELKQIEIGAMLKKEEIIYGIIQFICITFTILIYKVYNGI